MRRGGEEQAVLEPGRQIADGAGESGLDAVAAAGRGCGVMRLVEDQEAAFEPRAEPLAHRIGVGRVDQQVVRDEETAVRAPGVDAEAPLAAHSRDVGAVEDLEDQAEALLELALPLFEHRRRGGDDDGLRLAPQEQFAGDQAGLDGLAEAGVVGDEEVDAGQAERLAQRLHLVGVERDAGAERGLEEAGIRRRRAVPAQGVEERGEPAGVVEAARGQIGPAFLGEDAPVDLVVPEHGERFALGIVLRTGEFDDGRLVGAGGDDVLDQPAPRAHLNQVADLRRVLRQTLERMQRLARLAHRR